MKATIREHVPGDAMRHAVPPAYRDLVAKQVSPEGQYTLLLFAHAERDVIHSMPVRRTLRRLPETPPHDVVAVGTTFTQEAKALLAELDAAVVELRKTKWTDASAAERQP